MLNRCILFVILLFSPLTSAIADAWISWAEFDPGGNSIQIFLSRETNNSTDQVLTVSQFGMNFTPSLLATSNTLWLVWVDRANNSKYSLHYAKVNPTTLTILQSGIVQTKDDKIYAPVIALTSNGTPVVAWSGLARDNEEIRIAYFVNGKWRPEEHITNNNSPDTLPSFSNNQDGDLMLSWELISNKGIFIQSYTLNSNRTSSRSANTNALNYSSAPATGENRLNTRKNRMHSLPQSLKNRQNRFFMGSKAIITE